MKAKIIFISILFICCNSFSQYKTLIEDNRLLVKNSFNKFGVTDTIGNTIVPFIYDNIKYKNGQLLSEKGKRTGMLDLENKVIVPFEYEFILPRKNNRFLLWTPTSLMGLCDNNGQIIIPVKYKSISSNSNDDLYITKNDKNLNGVLDYNGKEILAELYTFFTIDDDKIFAQKDNIPQIIDLKKLEKTIYLSNDINFIETVRHYSSNERFFQIIKQNNKYGIINSNNDLIIPTIYDEIKSSQNWKYFIIKKGNNLGLINIDGKIVKEVKYDKIELRKEYILLKKKNHSDEIYSYE